MAASRSSRPSGGNEHAQRRGNSVAEGDESADYRKWPGDSLPPATILPHLTGEKDWTSFFYKNGELAEALQNLRITKFTFWKSLSLQKIWKKKMFGFWKIFKFTKDFKFTKKKNSAILSFTKV